MNDYDFGSAVRLSVEFTNPSGVLTDPTTITLRVEDPNELLNVYTDAVKDAVGIYHRDITCSTAGIWHWRWEATGALAQVDEGEFRINASAFG